MVAINPPQVELRHAWPPLPATRIFFRRWLGVVAVVSSLASFGCTTLVDRQLRGEIAGYESATDGTRGVVSALPEWNGGCLWPYVDLYTGSLFVHQALLSSTALGVDWEVGLYYNSSLPAASGHLGPGWRHSYHIVLQPGVPGPANITIEWADGRADVFTDDGAGGWTADPALQGRRITAIAGGYALRTKHGLVYEFDLSGRLIRIVDSNGNALTFAYDFLGRLATVTDPSGRLCQYQYDGLDRLIRITGLPPQPIEFFYDASSRLERVTGAYPCEYQYDGLNRLIRSVDPVGNPIDYEYNPGLPVIHAVSAGSAKRTFGFDQSTLTTTLIDRLDASNNAVTLYQFDGLGRIVRVDDGVLGVSTNNYGPLNLVEEHTDADGHLSHYQYDARGNVVKYTDPTAAVTTYSYEPTFSQLTGMVDPLGKSWTWVRAPGTGNLLQFRDPLGNPTDYTYDGLGRLITHRDPIGNVTTYGYDANSNLASVTDAAGFGVSVVRNIRGAPQSITDQEGNVWPLTLNARDEVVGVQVPGPPASYSMTYTPAGFLQGIQDPMGALTSYSYDGLNRLIRATGVMASSREWVRNDAGHVTQRIDALGGTEFLQRDPVGRLLSRIGPEGTVETYTYDCCDRRTVTDAMGNTLSLDYTADHKLMHMAWPGIDHVYAYDAMDRLIQATRTRVGDPPISYTYDYDDAGRRVGIHAPHIGRNATLVYNAAGDPIQVFDTIRPAPVNFTYNARRLISQASRPAVATIGAVYTARGQLKTLTYPGGASSNYSYDAASRLISVLNQSPSFNASYAVSVDSRGDRTAVLATTPVTGPRDLHVGRDPKGRPSAEQYTPGGITNYTYDPVDNRRTANADVYSYSPEYRLLNAGPSIFQNWNLNRSVTQLTEPGRVTNYFYGADGMLESIERGGQIWKFTLGPFGEVARVIDPSGVQSWRAVDEAGGRLLRRTFHPGPGLQPSVESIYGVMRAEGGRPTPISEYWGAGTVAGFRATLADPDGSPTQVANSVGTLVADRYFGLYGDLQAHLGAQQPIQSFQGMDAVTGLDGLFFGAGAGSNPFLADLPFSVTTAPEDTRPGRVSYFPAVASFQQDRGFGTDCLAADVNAEGVIGDFDLDDVLVHLAQDPPPAPPPVAQANDGLKGIFARELASEIQRLGWWRGLIRFMWKVYNYNRSKAIEEGKPVPPELPDPYPPEDPLGGLLQ
jgi:YD repeat-containing protein